MKKTFFRLCGLSLSLILCTAGLFAQIMEDRAVPPPPVVSALQAQVTENKVALSWIAALDMDGDNIILRSTEPVTAANRHNAVIVGTVPYTVTSFSDTLPDQGDYYYAILSKDSSGTEYAFFLPVTNSLILPVRAEIAAKPAEPVMLTGFDAITREDAVIITWETPERGRNLVLYRATTPFTNMNSLLQAVVLSAFTDSGTPFVDYPVPGVPYYYALVDEETLRTGTADFTPSLNTNRIPVEVSSSYAGMYKNYLPSIRAMPLPYLNPGNEFRHYNVVFSPDTEDIIRKITVPVKVRAVRQREAFLFQSDLLSDTGGEEFALRKVLDETFRLQQWESSISALNQFLSIRRTADITARAHFYLGQAYSFQGLHREALQEFLLAQDRYYSQSRDWIQYVLSNLVSGSQSGY